MSSADIPFRLLILKTRRLQKPTDAKGAVLDFTAADAAYCSSISMGVLRLRAFEYKMKVRSVIDHVFSMQLDEHSIEFKIQKLLFPCSLSSVLLVYVNVKSEYVHHFNRGCY